MATSIYMARAVQETAKYSENLLPRFATFEDTITWNETQVSGAGAIAVTNDTATYYKKDKSLKFVVSDWEGTVDTGDDKLEFTIGKTGTYVLSGRVKATSTFDAEVCILVLKVFKNAVHHISFIIEIDATKGFVFDKWNAYFQNMALVAGDVINLAFDVDYIGAAIEFNLDGLKLELEDKEVYGLTTYSYPKEEVYHGWQSRVDTSNTQVLTGLTNNLIAFTGMLEQNGGLTLMDSNAKVTPISLNDIITVDFSFTTLTPAGSDHYVNANFVVGGVVYRSATFMLVKGAGIQEPNSVSFTLPVTATFLANGGTFNIYPSTGVTISNRYIAVTRTHKGV